MRSFRVTYHDDGIDTISTAARTPPTTNVQVVEKQQEQQQQQQQQHQHQQKQQQRATTTTTTTTVRVGRIICWGFSCETNADAQVHLRQNLVLREWKTTAYPDETIPVAYEVRYTVLTPVSYTHLTLPTKA